MLEPTEKIRKEDRGFSGLYYENRKTRTYRTVIAMMDEDAASLMNRAAAKWLTKFHGVNALCISINEEGDPDTGVRSWPLENIENAVKWLMGEKRMDAVGIMGISMQAVIALTAASLMPDITLAIAFAPCDFMPWGFHKGPIGRYRNAEYPSGTSLLTWRGEELPYVRSAYEGEGYWKHFLSEKKKYREMHTSSFFEDAEERFGFSESVRIKAEDINGTVVLVGTEDDSMWKSADYIRRMHGKLMKKGFRHEVHAFIYAYGTHLLVPERLLYSAFPVGGGLVQRMFRSGKKHSSACRAAREELEEKLTSIIDGWR